MISTEMESEIRSIVRDEMAKRFASKNEWMAKICNEVISECSDEEWEELVHVCVFSDQKTPIPKLIDALLLKKAALHLNCDLSTTQKHNVRAALKEAVKKVADKDG